ANLLKVAESEGFEPSRPRKRPTRFPIVLLRPLGQLSMAPQVGFEPTTDRLTADSSTAELLWNGFKIAWRRPTLTEAKPQLPSALESLTTVFGMGTGVTSPLLLPDKIYYKHFLRKMQGIILFIP